MKKLVYLLVLFAGVAKAQIVNIPDANFKAALLPYVDANTDGNIQVSEALATTFINISAANISDLTGISSFTNLVNLNCSNNNLTSLDLSALTHLTTLLIYSNHLTSFDATPLVNLVTFDCSSNNLTNLNVTGLSNLQNLYIENNPLLSSINLNGLTSLKEFNFALDTFSDLDLTPFLNLTTLRPGSVTNTLNLSNTNIVYFLPYEDGPWSIGTLNLSNCIHLVGLDLIQQLYGYTIGILNVSNCTGMTILKLADSPVLNLNFTGCTALTHLTLNGCSLHQLDVSSLTNLQVLSCNNGLLNSQNNYIETIDITNNPNLTYLDCGTPSLKYIYAKNGRGALTTQSIYDSPNLLFACVDESQVTTLQSIAPATAQVSSYCTFTPGGNYNTITGTLTFDGNNNGCDASDNIRPDVRVNINDGTNTGASFTNDAGNYTFYTQTGSFDITPSIENPSWFTFSPVSATIPFANNNNNVATQNFCITANGGHPDLEVVVAPITRARPGFDAVYKIVYKNKGNQTVNGVVSFAYDEAKMDYISATQTPDLINPGNLFWDFGVLQPFENRSFYIILHVNPPTASPAVNIGDVLTFTATIDPLVTDEVPADNTFQYNQTVVGSFDPNDITCIEGNIVPPAEIGNYLHYIINFENTGTADAENIVVKDIIDTTKFDVNSLQVLNSSDAVTAKLTGNVAEFIFQNINLHSGGHGNILIKIKSKNTLVEGSTVSKKANIYFDYNSPIDTNMENTTFQALSNPDFETDASITVYPNPTRNMINIKADNTITSIQLFDVQGRLLQTNLVNQTQATLDITSQSNGIYFVKVVSDKGIMVQKIMKK